MNTPDLTSAGSPENASGSPPFGIQPATRFGRVRRIAAAALVIAVAVAAAAYFSGAVRAPTASDDETQDHAAMDASGDSMDSMAKGDPSSGVSLTAAQAARIGVTYASVTRRALGREIRAVGVVTADEARVRHLSLKVDGWVERLAVNVTGQRVTEGEPLLDLYSPLLVAAQEELLLAKGLSARFEESGPEATAAAARDATARDGARALLASARERLRYWDVPAEEVAAIEREGKVRRAITMLARSSGEVIEKRVVEGQRVMAGDALFRIADLSRVWVEADVYAQDVGLVRLGQMVSLEFEAFPGRQRRAAVTFVQPTVDAASRTLRVRVELENADRQLRPGMYATLRLEAARGGPLLSVPRSAVLETGERALVFVRGADGALRARTVRLGVRTNEWIEVLQGVVEGEVVVSSATFLVDAESSLRALSGGAGAMVGMPGMPMDTP